MEQLRGCIALLKVVHERHDKFAALVLVFGAVSALYYIVGSLGWHSCEILIASAIRQRGEKVGCVVCEQHNKSSVFGRAEQTRFEFSLNILARYFSSANVWSLHTHICTKPRNARHKNWRFCLIIWKYEFILLFKYAFSSSIGWTLIGVTTRQLSPIFC
jgi:hypothetical protein